MPKHVLKMSKWFLLFTTLNLIAFVTCHLSLYIVGSDDNNFPYHVSDTLETTIGSNITLTCSISGKIDSYSDPELVWGKRSKQLRFRNESDLEKLAQRGFPYLYSFYYHNGLRYYKNRSIIKFTPVKSSDQGLYFCMCLKYMLFKVVHIKVTEKKPESLLWCKKDKFRCAESGRCINLHYKCDGKTDCWDGSDEYFTTCGENPCKGKIQCLDGRCIPTTWCCDKLTDDNCTVAVRPTCCPPLVDLYDPIHWYNNQTTIKDTSKGNSSRYLFISICVISAILSFVLFLFVISKLCGFDKSPNRSRTANSDPVRNQTTCFSNLNSCEHSECAIRREFNSNIVCLYRTSSNNAQNSNSNSNELVDPLITIRGQSLSEVSDQPPPYEEVVAVPPIIDKNLISYLINAPPPPYSSTNFLPETENGNNLNASNRSNNQNIGCDSNVTSDRSNCRE